MSDPYTCTVLAAKEAVVKREDHTCDHIALIFGMYKEAIDSYDSISGEMVDIPLSIGRSLQLKFKLETTILFHM